MNSLKRRALLIAACGVALTATLLPAGAHESADPDPARFESEIRAFEAWDRKNAVPDHPVLFVGSSSIRLWRTAESFPELSVVNRGFGGSHTSDVNHFADRIVFKYKPRLIVFYAGDNDIAAGKSPRQVFEDFKAFINLVDSELPETRIIYLPIKPSLARWKLWPDMQEANAMIERSAQSDDRLEYVDTATPMLGDDGQPRPEIFLGDGLHMNAAGYQIWSEKLAPLLRNPSRTQ